jgi:uncharacterized alkaline shock family protein YloU
MISNSGEQPTSLQLLLAPTSQRLACGASIDDILEQVAHGRDHDLSEHQQHCIHCQAALRDLSGLWAPVREYASQPVPVPQRLADAVIRNVGRLVQDVWYTLQVTQDGSIRVAARVIAAIARDTAKLVPGVRVALGRSTQPRLAALVEKATMGHRHPHAAVGVLGRTAVIDLAIAVTYGERVHDVAHDVQQRVMAELRSNVGLQSVTVNVTVDDLLA